jgi:heavy metal translocating P-type ATPase
MSADADADADAAACAFCDGPLPPDADGAFCRPACRELDDALGEPGAAVGDAASDGDRQFAAAEADTAPATDATRTFFRVDGMYSPTCEAYLEAVAIDYEGVATVEASYITETVRVDHDPEAASTATLRDALSTLGYTAYLRENAERTTADSASATRREREMGGLRKRRDDQLLGLRYAAGVLFGAFLFVPYVAVLYPSYLSAAVDWWLFHQFEGAFRLDGAGGLLFVRVYLVMTGVVLFFTGMPILRGAYVSLKMRRPTTDLLVATTAVSAYAYSTLAALSGHTDIYYDLTIVVAAAVTAAVFYESAIKRRALERLTDLTVSQVDTARRVGADGTTEVAVEAVESGDELLVREGERIPVDGVLAEGPCTVDESVVTGESLPVTKTEGDAVVGGSILTDGVAVVRADAGAVSGLDRITTAVWGVQSARHGTQRQADRLAARSLLVVGTAAVLAATGTYLADGGGLAILLATLLALFVVGPWALGLATPLSVAASLRAALQRGIVVFDESLFERLRDIDVVVFDKTGTLTTGAMEVTDADVPGGLRSAVVALERRANHPVARALVAAFEEPSDGAAVADGGTGRGAESDPDIESFRSHETGVEGVVDGDRVLVGNLELFAEQGWSVGADLEARTREIREFGRVPVIVGQDGTAEGLVVVGDEPREAWSETLFRLADRDIDAVVLTGDHAEATAFLRDHDAVSRAFAGVSPAGKAEAVRRLAADRRVAMVGDGTNDALALAAADLGVSLGSGTALAADAADVAIVDDDLRAVETAFDIAATARRRVRQNVALAGLYNAVVIPAALVDALNPLVTTGAVLLAGGAIAVNAMRSFAA